MYSALFIKYNLYFSIIFQILVPIFFNFKFQKVFPKKKWNTGQLKSTKKNMFSIFKCYKIYLAHPSKHKKIQNYLFLWIRRFKSNCKTSICRTFIDFGTSTVALIVMDVNKQDKGSERDTFSLYMRQR